MRALESDRQTLTDDLAEPEEREEALQRLACDGVTDLQAAVEPLASHEDDSLRQWALHYLVQTLQLPEFVEVAKERLRAGMDGEPMLEASMAAYSLSWYALQQPSKRQEICAVLADVLRAASDSETQRACYEGILRALGNKLASVSKPFERDRDVDWALVEESVSGVGRPDRG